MLSYENQNLVELQSASSTVRNIIMKKVTGQNDGTYFQFNFLNMA